MTSETARHLRGPALAAALRESRAVTLARTWPMLADERLVPRQSGVNPLAWELGHLAWFADFWVRRGPHAVDDRGAVRATRPALAALPDAVYDSSRLGHAERWQAPLHAPARLAEVLAAQLEATVAALPSGADGGDEAHAAHRLALFHEDMHGEAFAWTAAALGWPAPPGLETPPRLAAPAAPEIAVAATPSFRLGRGDGETGYAFDNERPPRVVDLEAFAIDSAVRTAADVIAFVEAGGYAASGLWAGDAAVWRAERPGLAHPAHWRHAPAGSADGWQLRWFDRWLPLDPALPALFLSAFEAEAVAAWLGRRLPRAAEWERAAQDPRFAWGGSVWEWTADAFLPYPGFSPGPYRDYSAPWFGDHRELRGSAVATHPRLHDRRYRNFFRPGRTDLFTGFRTVTTSPASA